MTTIKGRISPRFLIVSFAATTLAQSHFVSAFYLPTSSHISRRFLTRTSPAPSPKTNLLVRSPSSSSSSSSSSSPTKLSGLFDDANSKLEEEEEEFDYLTTPFASLPPTLQNEIYAAESQTPSSQNRLQRILLYVALAVLGASIAFFNAFLENLRYGEGSPSSDLATYGFEWVEGNGIWDFLFLTKVGGAWGLVGAGLAGTLAEVEFRSKKENAEKIWAEMQRRRSLKDKRSASASASGTTSSKRKKRRSKEMTGKQKKRISALTELMTMEEEATKISENADVDVASKAEDANDSNEGQLNANTNTKTDTTGDEANKSPGGGIFDSIKNFYEKADSMAASQALLLNKELEDRGIVEKITDETGLKVIGKEAAKELKRSSRGNADEGDGNGDGDGGNGVSRGEKATNRE